MNKNHFITKFSKTKPSFYKLTNKQIKQLMNYLMFEINQEELNEAIGYTFNCPYCNSKDIYKTQNKSHLYKFKCETCNKKFTNLSKSIISYLLPEEYINKGERFFFKESLKNIEIWLCFDVKYDRRYKNIPRENLIGNVSDWRYGLLQIPRCLKRDSLVSIQEQNEESFYRLLASYTTNSNKKKKTTNSDKKFIILTFNEGQFVPKQSINNLKSMKAENNPYKRYQDDVGKKKVLQEYKYLRDTLIESYNIECETLHEPKREEKIYKDIEIPYKHTYTLAFEMAIRNKEVKKILYALKYLRDINDKLNLITKEYLRDQGHSFNIPHKATKNYNRNIKNYNKRLLLLYPFYLNSELHDQYLSIGLYTIDSLIKDFEYELRKKYLIIPKENKIKTSESNMVLIKRATHNSTNLKNGKKSLKDIKYKFEEQVHDDYTNTMGVYEDSDIFDISIIRPTFNLHTIENNISHVPINFTLPTEEILAFIEKIKQDLEKNENLIRSPLELLGEDIEIIEAENVEKYLPKTFKDKLETMSNALFTYDKFKYLINKNKQLKSKKDRLEKELKKEKEVYTRPGRSTKIQKTNIKRIEAKYESEIEDCKKSMNAIKKAKKDKYKNIYREVNIAETTLGRYFTFMNRYINNLKYKKLFIKTKDDSTHEPLSDN